MRLNRIIACITLKATIGLGLTALSAGGVNAIEISINDEQVISQSGSPFVNNIEGQLDLTGRPFISADVTFISPCVMDAGLDVTHIRSGNDRPDVVILQQAVSQAGCPDIASPIDQLVQILLPANITQNGVHIISKPWRANDGNSLNKPLTFVKTTSVPHDSVIEARTIHGHLLAHVNIQTLRLITDTGYTLSGKIELGKCKASEVIASVFEIPDADGNPIADTLIITLPEACSAPDFDTELTVDVVVPPRGLDRVMVVLNEVIPIIRAIK